MPRKVPYAEKAFYAHYGKCVTDESAYYAVVYPISQGIRGSKRDVE